MIDFETSFINMAKCQETAGKSLLISDCIGLDMI